MFVAHLLKGLFKRENFRWLFWIHGLIAPFSLSIKIVWTNIPLLLLIGRISSFEFHQVVFRRPSSTFSLYGMHLGKVKDNSACYVLISVTVYRLSTSSFSGRYHPPCGVHDPLNESNWCHYQWWPRLGNARPTNSSPALFLWTTSSSIWIWNTNWGF